MRKLLIIISYLLLGSQGKAQTEDSITKIDDFFAGIPVKAGFEKWVEYLYKHPYMGLDSANYRGSYSSFKPGIKSHFPFPDSVQVKILAENILVRVPGIDTLIRHRQLLIEGVFGNSRTSEKNAWKSFDELKKMLKSYYKIRNSFDSFVDYSKGINDKFPPFRLQLDYSKELGFYYVILMCESEDTLITK